MRESCRHSLGCQSSTELSSAFAETHPSVLWITSFARRQPRPSSHRPTSVGIKGLARMPAPTNAPAALLFLAQANWQRRIGPDRRQLRQSFGRNEVIHTRHSLAPQALAIRSMARLPGASSTAGVAGNCAAMRWRADFVKMFGFVHQQQTGTLQRLLLRLRQRLAGGKRLGVQHQHAGLNSSTRLATAPHSTA